MKRLILFYVSLMMTAFTSQVIAQMPVMKVQGESNTSTTAVTLKNMDIHVEIFGNVAVTTMQMVFHNNTSRILEGELTFPMPDGVTVSRYAIDINGKLREAVPVAKAKATEVFESIEHRRVDPGLLERVEGNNFRTRVYPLPANGERTVMVAYEEALSFQNGNALQYHLPLAYPSAIQAFSLQVKVYQSAQKPQLTEQPDGSLSFAESGNIYEASMQRTDFKPSKALTINLPKAQNVPEIAMQQNTDGSFYFLINAWPTSDMRPKTWSNHIGIIWDNSLSRQSKDNSKEMELIDRIIRQKQNLTVELGLLNITFKKAKTFTIKNGDWSELKNYLQSLHYDGGTDFSQLNEQTLSADEYLLFSDGLSTFGENNIQINKPIYSICSSQKADFSTLRAVSSRTGGKFINLTNTSVDEAFRQISNNSLQFMGIEEKSIVSEVYPSMPQETNGHIAVTGILRTSSGEITLLFGRNGKIETKQKVKLHPGNTDIKVNRVWAQMKIAEMDIQYDKNKEDIELLGKQFGIVTRNTSLLVLENVADYVRYEITPPAELLSEYNKLSKDLRGQKEVRVNDLLQRAIAKVNELKEWWKTDFKETKYFPVPKNEPAVELRRAQAEESALYESAVVADNIQQVNDAEVTTDGAQNQGSRSETRRMRQAGAIADAPPPPSPQGSSVDKSPVQTAYINIPTIKNDKDYIQRITSASNPYEEYLALRETYLGTPGFFLDVSDYFYEKKQPETGLLVLTCLAELELENAELFKTLAYKLKERGNYKSELYITGKVREWRPMDPQSHRDYALALQDNGRYQEALDCLYGILNGSYSPESAARDFGIEETIVCEINNLILRYKNKLNLSQIDPKIIAELPVNIRVVINWNKNDTDIDLWVTDPRGEKCFYSHKLTASGGRISDDFTQGFGPEQYMIKKAMNGTYKVETNFFGERQVTLSGPTTIMAEIYLYYGDGRQERQVVTLRSGEQGKEKAGVLIGEFVFSDAKTAMKTIDTEGIDEIGKDAGNAELASDKSDPDSKSGRPFAAWPVVAGLGLLGLWRTLSRR